MVRFSYAFDVLCKTCCAHVRRLTASACLTLVIFGSAARAENYALLVGVAQVPALPAKVWLQGPDNDVALMREVLLQHGFAQQHITVLAQRSASARARPTHAAITAAMQGLLARSSHGDRVLLHLAGHGTQVPERSDAAHVEADGLDEAFLAEDVQRWDAQAQRLPNALMDHEVGRWIDALVDRGVQVWAVFDTCHAAGMARGPTARGRLRSVAASELGIPTLGVLPLAAARAGTPPTPRLDGRVLAFAARSHEATGEERLPAAAGQRTAQVRGVFSTAVIDSIQLGHTSATSLAQALARRYAKEKRASPVPQVMGLGGPLH